MSPRIRDIVAPSSRVLCHPFPGLLFICGFSNSSPCLAPSKRHVLNRLEFNWIPIKGQTSQIGLRSEPSPNLSILLGRVSYSPDHLRPTGRPHFQAERPNEGCTQSEGVSLIQLETTGRVELNNMNVLKATALLQSPGC